jgi:hypothetical protein
MPRTANAAAVTGISIRVTEEFPTTSVVCG